MKALDWLVPRLAGVCIAIAAAQYWRTEMKSILVYLLTLLTPDPRGSIEIAARLTGADASELRHIAIRESSLRPVGVHPRDAGNSSRAHARALAAGWLSANCPHHHGHEGGWASRGIFGLYAAYHLRWLEPYGLDCAPPWVLDVPLVSALAAAAKHEARCWTETKWGRELKPEGGVGWCR